MEKQASLHLPVESPQATVLRASGSRWNLIGWLKLATAAIAALCYLGYWSLDRSVGRLESGSKEFSWEEVS